MLEQLKVMTDDEFMARYSFIVIDEVHKRDMNIDIVLMLLKRLVHRNSKKSICPFVIVMSATIDTKKFGKYFNTQTIYEVGGKAHPISEHFLEKSVEKYAPHIVERAISLHTKRTEDLEENVRDILVFVPGLVEIDFVVKGLADVKGLRAIPLHRENFQKGTPEFQSIFVPIETLGAGINRRCIVSTALAETGVTIETVKYVIDSGWSRTSEFYPPFGVYALVTKPTTKDSATQRKGRSGRKGPGEWYPMYTKDTYTKMQDIAHPDILRNDISSALLNIFIKQQLDSAEQMGNNEFKFNLKDVDLLDPPSSDGLQLALEKLYVMGAIKPYKVTPLGLVLSSLNLPIEVGRLIMAGYAYNTATTDLATIAAGLIVEQRNMIDNFKTYDASIGKHIFTTFSLPLSKSETLKNLNKSYAKTLEFVGCQFIEFIFLLDEFINKCKELKFNMTKIKAWTLDIGLEYDGMMNFIETRDEILKILYINGFSLSGIPIMTSVKEEEFIEGVLNIKRCIYEGYKLNVAVCGGSTNSYYSERHKYSVIPQAGFVFKTSPSYIMYARATMFYNTKKKVYEAKAFTTSVLDGWIADEHDSKFTGLQDNGVKFDKGEPSFNKIQLYKDICKVQPKGTSAAPRSDKKVEKTYNEKEIKYDPKSKTYKPVSDKPKTGGGPNKIMWF